MFTFKYELDYVLIYDLQDDPGSKLFFEWKPLFFIVDLERAGYFTSEMIVYNTYICFSNLQKVKCLKSLNVFKYVLNRTATVFFVACTLFASISVTM